MNRILAIVLTVLMAVPALAGGYSYSGGYYWKNGVAYNRYIYSNCYSRTGYSYGYKAAAVVKSYPVTNNNNSKTYTYYINYSQPTAEQGSTLYGLPSSQLSLQSYGNVDLGATVDGLLRLSTDTQAGAIKVAGEVRGLAGDIAAYASQQNQAALAIAEYQAQAELLRAAKPQGQLSLQYGQGGGHAGGYGGGQGGGEFQAPQSKWGPLTTQYCASCHGDNGSNRDVFALDDLFTFDGYIAAQAAITHDDPTLRMPKGIEVDANTRGAILNELSATVKYFLQSQR